MHERTAENIYDKLTVEGEYKSIGKDGAVIRKMIKSAHEHAGYIDFLLEQKFINWEIIYTLYYDVLRVLCEALLRFNETKISNHQGCFAYICVKFPDLELDWSFFEKIRGTRNRNKYEASSISQRDWKEVEIQIKLYVSTLRKEIEERLKN